MDPSPPPAATDSTASSPRHPTDTDPPPKLRLMCSYGGQILPRPHDKSLCYIGGETRLILSDRHVSLPELTARLSKTLLAGKPFSLRYQLPTEDLDSLISVTTDEDLENMIEEYDRLLTRKPLTRIRLFLFTDSTPSFGSAKSEDWFLNALNGSNLVDLPESASVNCLLGLDDVVVSNGGGKEDAKEVVVRKQGGGAQDVHSVPDSPILDTSSSFGSTSSSPAMANLPPIRVHVEEQKAQALAPAVGIEEGKVEDGGFFVIPTTVMAPASVADMASPDSISSDNSLTNSMARQRNMIYQDPSLQIQIQNQNQNTPSNRIPTPIDPKLSDPNHNYQFPNQFDQQFQQLNPNHIQPSSQYIQPGSQYIQSGSQYIPQNAVPAPAYYIVYPPPQQQYSSAYVSARPAQPYNIQSSYAPSMGSSQNPQNFMGYPPIHHQSQSITGNYAYEYADPASQRVVYTQPMAPQMAVQYQNNAPVLSEASAQVPNESFKMQNRGAQL